MARGTMLLGGAAFLSFVVAALHIWIIAVGAPAYRYTGAGETMVRLAEHGSRLPALVTIGALALFVLAGLYPLSASGVLPRLPWLRAGPSTLARNDPALLARSGPLGGVSGEGAGRQ